MIRRLSVFILLAATSATATFGQTAPESKRQIEKESSRIFLGAPVSGSYLGVQTQEVTKENFAKYGLNEVRGVAIENVAKDSPAAKAGLQKGDVILRFNDEEVTSVFKLTRLLGEVAPDHQVKVTILRGGGESELTVTPGKREMLAFQSGGFNMGDFPTTLVMPNFPRVPMPPNGAMLPRGGDGNDFFIYRGSGANRRIGIGIAPLTKQLGDYFGVVDGRGVLIESVRENSPAARAGLKAGDVVTEIDGREIKNSSDLTRAINSKKDGDVSLTFLRDKNRQTVMITPEISKDAPMPFSEFQNFGDGQPMRFRMMVPTAPVAPLPPNQTKPAPPRVL